MDVLVKSHAAAARVAAGIDAMLALRQEYGFSGDDIASMHLGIPKRDPGPADQSASGRSAGGTDVPAVQRGARLRRCRWRPVASRRSRSPTTRQDSDDRRLFEIEDRITIALDDEVEAASNALSTAAKVSVRLRDGRELDDNSCRRRKAAPAIRSRREEHEARFIQELSSRVSDKVCAEIVAMSKELDRLDPRWLGRVLSAVAR